MSLLESIRKSAVGRWIKRSPALREAAIFVHNVIGRPPHFRRRVRLNIGGCGEFELDYQFGHFRYEEFGDAHNACFRNWRQLCTGRKAVFDIGAHIGLYTLPASRALAPGGVIYAFEPSPANLKVLERHCRYNGLTNVVLCPFLLGDADRDAVPFYESARSDAMNSVVLVKDPRTYRRVLRKQQTIDEFCKVRGVIPELIKLDVEGNEINVLRGALRTLQEHHPTLVLSVHPSRIEKLGQSVADLERLLAQLDYRTLDQAYQPVRDPLGFGEYILIHSEK